MARGVPPSEILLVGPAGTGKTWGILTLFHLFSLQRPNMRVLVARKTRESLTESVLVTYEREVLPMTGHSFIAEGITRKIRSVYRYPNGTEWIIGGLDKPTKLLSTSYDIGFCNEAIECNISDWETLQSRIGRPDSVLNWNFLLGDTNPGDSSHWLLKRGEAGLLEIWDTVHRDNPALWQGTGWTERGRRYIERLRRLTGSRRQRLLDGKWVAGEGAWFESFISEGDNSHVSETAEYNPKLDVFLAVDSGVHAGAVWFQVDDSGREPIVNVFGDLYTFQRPAYEQAREVLARSAAICGGRVDYGITDPAYSHSTAVGPTVIGEYERAGLKLDPWLQSSVLDGLALIESLVSIYPSRIRVHPRCTHLIQAFGNYVRKQNKGQWIDRPEDPQHPYEDMIDALRGGLMWAIGSNATGSWGSSPLDPQWRG